MVLLMMAVMCGCAGSTSGGVKADRVLLLIKAAGTHIRRSLHPNGVNEVRIGTHVVRDEDLTPQLLYVGFYVLILAFSVLLCMLFGVDNQNAFAASVTSLGNVGPAVGSLGTMGSFADVPEAAKFVFTMDMFFGRVEIYPVLSVLAMLFDRSK